MEFEGRLAQVPIERLDLAELMQPGSVWLNLGGRVVLRVAAVTQPDRCMAGLNNFQFCLMQ